MTIPMPPLQSLSSSYRHSFVRCNFDRALQRRFTSWGMFMFFNTASGVPQSNNKFFRFKWIWGSCLLATYRVFLNQTMTHIGPMVFMLTLLDNTLCLAAIEVLSRKAYNCSPRISSVSNNAWFLFDFVYSPSLRHRPKPLIKSVC